MDIFGMLMEEHRLIGHVLVAFESYFEEIEQGSQPDRHELHRFTLFFRDFAELAHHRKEEALLFPAIERLGNDEQRIALGRLQHDHEKVDVSKVDHPAHGNRVHATA